MENPPRTAGGQRRELADDADVIIHESDEGLALVVDNHGKREIILRFDFADCENLTMVPAPGIEKVSDTRCNTTSKAGTAVNLCELKIANSSISSFGMRYRVQCLVRGSNGELVQVGPSGRGAPPAPSASGAKSEDEETKPITETLTLIISQTAEHGYILSFQSTDADTYHVSVDFSKSENLGVTASRGFELVGGSRVSGQVEKGDRVPFAALHVLDFGKGSCSLNYSCQQRKDSANRLQREKEAKVEAERLQQQRAEDDAKRKAAEEEARRKAEEERARKAAADEEARRQAEEERARKAAAEEAARRQAEEERARKAAEEEEAKRHAAAKREAEEAKRRADEEAARRKAEEEEAARKAAAEEAARQHAEAEAARHAREAEAAATAAAKRDAELKRIEAKKQLVEKEWMVIRLKFEAEWRAWWLVLERQWRESICALCRKPHREGVTIVEYKVYRLHKPCFDAAPKCNVCGDILIGEYVQTKGENAGIKLHKECIDAYKKGTRPVCGSCGKQIMDAKWSTNGGVHYHSQCRSQE